jgi:hypothetical protein
VTSTFPGKTASDMGAWKHTAGDVAPADPDDKGLQTSEDSRHYGISALLPAAFSSAGKDLVVQYSVKFDQKIDCGGAYIKLGAAADQATFSGDTPYQIMFGPDVCGGTRKTHVVSFLQTQDLPSFWGVRCRFRFRLLARLQVVYLPPPNPLSHSPASLLAHTDAPLFRSSTTAAKTWR